MSFFLIALSAALIIGALRGAALRSTPQPATVARTARRSPLPVATRRAACSTRRLAA